jgi:hypothetical protein
MGKQRNMLLSREFFTNNFNRQDSAERKCFRHGAAIAYSLTFVLILILGSSGSFATKRYAAVNGSDSNPGTVSRPVKSVKKAFSLAKPGDTVLFSAGKYTATAEKIPSGRSEAYITILSRGNGKVVFTNDGATHLILPGSYNKIVGIEFEMTGDKPKGNAIEIEKKEHIEIRRCRFYATNKGVNVYSSSYLLIRDCEMAFMGTYGVHLNGSGAINHPGVAPQLSMQDQSYWVEVRNCYMHDIGWNIEGTEGYGVTANGAVEQLVVENCQFDNMTGDAILYEDWTVHSTARYNVIRGCAIAGIWIDNASMSIFDNNFLYANNVGIWMSGEVSSNRYLVDMISIRNNIIVHNNLSDYVTPPGTNLYGRSTLLFTSNTRDFYFDNNTVAFNKNTRMISFQNRPPQNHFRNLWFRNNIFWGNTPGGVVYDAGVDTTGIHYENNLWNTAYAGDAKAHTGDPLFVDPASSSPEGYQLKAGSAAIDKGMLLYENQLDFWQGVRPHRPQTGLYDIGAHEFGTKGTGKIGLDMSTFPFEVKPFKLEFNAKPKR